MFAVLAMFLMVPMSFAKTAITESDLAAVTAQEGVTINFDCFTVGAISIDVQSWGDSDGCTTCGGFTSTGWVGAEIDMSSDFVTISGDMTIDVGTNSGGVTALAIGLPTLNLVGSMTQVVKLANNAQLTGGSVLGTAYMSGLSVSPSGVLIIHAH
ncbi:MAG TPA: hypothetical protein PKI91_04915 [Smithella sp.]|nr:hypothetical protein [Smithella sp.]HOU50658.1 hypothetical protein [Smithella sp.]HQG64649.1 hypothetical protein [Smithella sp.]